MYASVANSMLPFSSPLIYIGIYADTKNVRRSSAYSSPTSFECTVNLNSLRSSPSPSRLAFAILRYRLNNPSVIIWLHKGISSIKDITRDYQVNTMLLFYEYYRRVLAPRMKLVLCIRILSLDINCIYTFS